MSVLVDIHGEPSLHLFSDRVRAWVTPRGGMLGPVEFDLGNGRTTCPYALAPWLPKEAGPLQPPLLQVLRGDFFCFPFGTTPGVSHPHGPTANETWSVLYERPDHVEMTLACAAPVAIVRKSIALRAGETNVYQEHTVCAEGRFNYGHHPILHIPDGLTAEIRTSGFRFGAAYPGHAVRDAGERGVLQPGGRFETLDRAPLAAGGCTSLSRYPTRPGSEDIIMLAGFTGAHAWTAVTFDDYVWFSLRRTIDFPGTLFWMSNGGRSAPPWCDRHTRRIGIEDVCSHFCDGADVSRQDLLASEGIATARQFDPARPVRLPHVQGVVAVPPGFGGVAALAPDPADAGCACLTSETGAVVRSPLDWSFLD